MPASIAPSQRHPEELLYGKRPSASCWLRLSRQLWASTPCFRVGGCLVSQQIPQGIGKWAPVARILYTRLCGSLDCFCTPSRYQDQSPTPVMARFPNIPSCSTSSPSLSRGLPTQQKTVLPTSYLPSPSLLAATEAGDSMDPTRCSPEYRLTAGKPGELQIQGPCPEIREPG